jgi:hypothetical protein
MESISAPPAPLPPPQTKAAEFMTSLIKEVTPVKKLEAILNPYQTSSPVPVVTKKPKRERPVRSGSVEPEEKRETEKKVPEKREKEMSTQAIIEATVPKASLVCSATPGTTHLVSVSGKQALSPSRKSLPQRGYKLTTTTITTTAATTTTAESPPQDCRVASNNLNRCSTQSDS